MRGGVEQCVAGDGGAVQGAGIQNTGLVNLFVTGDMGVAGKHNVNIRVGYEVFYVARSMAVAHGGGDAVEIDSRDAGERNPQFFRVNPQTGIPLIDISDDRGHRCAGLLLFKQKRDHVFAAEVAAVDQVIRSGVVQGAERRFGAGKIAVCVGKDAEDHREIFQAAPRVGSIKQSRNSSVMPLIFLFKQREYSSSTAEYGKNFGSRSLN